MKGYIDSASLGFRQGDYSKVLSREVILNQIRCETVDFEGSWMGVGVDKGMMVLLKGPAQGEGKS